MHLMIWAGAIRGICSFVHTFGASIQITHLLQMDLE
jgi:hypothetical protein